MPKPHLNQQERFECPGPMKWAKAQLRKKRERMLPSLMLGFSFQRIHSARIVVDVPERGRVPLEIADPIVQACEASSVRPLVGLDHLSMQQQATVALRDAKEVWRTIVAETDPRTHCLAVCMFAIQLVDQGLLEDTRDQAVLVSLGMLDEAQEQGTYWAYCPGVLQPLSDKLLQRARLLGYYGGLSPQIQVA